MLLRIRWKFVPEIDEPFSHICNHHKYSKMCKGTEFRSWKFEILLLREMTDD